MPQENETEMLIERPKYMGQDRQEALNEDEVPNPEDNTEDNVEEEEVELVPEEKTFKKRYGDLRRHSQDQESQLKEQITDLEKQLLEATPNWTPPKTQEEISVWAEENPDAYDMFVSVSHDQTQQSTNEVIRLRNELRESKMEQDAATAKVIIINKHSDFNEIMESDEFHNWVEEQPKSIQDDIYDNATDGPLAIRMLDLYKMDMGISGTSKKKKDANKQAAAALVDTTSRETNKDATKKTFTHSEIEKMSLSEYENNEEDILKAQREGRILNE